MENWRANGWITPPPFEWAFLTVSSTSEWRADVETRRLDLPATLSKEDGIQILRDAVAGLRDAGVTRLVMRSSEWPAWAPSYLVRDTDLQIYDLDAAPQGAAAGAPGPLPDDVGRGRLDTVVINATVSEAEAIIELMRVWAQPEWAPLAPGDDPFRLVILLNQEPSSDWCAEVVAAKDSGALAESVTSVDIVPLAIPKDQDRYIKDRRGDPGTYGFKSGPNVQFFRGMEALEGSDDFALVIETDTRPIRRGWVSAARYEARQHSDAWVLGSVYRGPEHLSPQIRYHLNGNAIYSLGAGFALFRRQYWEPLLLDVIRSNPNAAYDFVLTLAMQGSAMPPPPVLLENLHRFRATSYIQNLVVWQRFRPVEVDWTSLVARIRERDPGTYMVHGVRGSQRSPWL